VDIAFPGGQGFRAIPECPSPGGVCVQVDVHRSAARQNPLPVFMGGLLGLGDQDVRASATARVAGGNTVECLRPFALPDFYSPTLANYSFPGYTLDEHLGERVLLKGGPGSQMAPGWFRLLDLIGGGGGGAPEVWRAIKGCAADPHTIGD